MMMMMISYGLNQSRKYVPRHKLTRKISYVNIRYWYILHPVICSPYFFDLNSLGSVFITSGIICQYMIIHISHQSRLFFSFMQLQAPSPSWFTLQHFIEYMIILCS